MRRIQRMLILLISVLLVVCFLPTTAQAEETAAGKFILVAEAGGKLVIAPEYITYASGQTIGAALEASEHIFTGLDLGQVTAIDGVTGNYTRSDQNGGYDLTTPASSVTHYCFSERASSESKPSDGMKLLMTAMADYLEKDADVRKAAKTAYDTVYTSFVGISSDDARTLAYELNKAVSDYESTLAGTEFAVSFTDGSKAYSEANYAGVSITAVNEYGKQWEDDGDGKLDLPQGSYTFCVSHDGLSFSGKTDVSSATTVSAALPTELWLKQDTFRLSGSYGAETSEESKFSDGEFQLSSWNGRTVTVPVFDSFVGTVYTYAEYNQDLLTEVPALTAVYTMKNATSDPMEKDIPFESLTSGAYSVLAKGSEGNTVIYRLSSAGTDGYTYAQDYTAVFERIPTLASISLVGTEEDGTVVDQAATTAFDGTISEYTYKVLDTIKSVTVSAVPLVDAYEVTVNGQSAKDGVTLNIEGETAVELLVSANGYTNTYKLNIQPGEGKTLSFLSDKAVTVEVVNSNGVVMPYTTHKEGTTQNRYKYTLVPGETYSYVATSNDYYHIADEFSLEEVANSIIYVDFEEMGDWLTELAFGTFNRSSYKNTVALDSPFTASNHRYEITYVDTEYNPYIWVASSEPDVTIEAVYNQVSLHNQYHGKERRIELTSGKSQGTNLNRFLLDENPIENMLTIRLSKMVDGVNYYQDYVTEFKRTLTLKNLSVKSDGIAAVLNQTDGTIGFDPDKKEYSVKVSMVAQELQLTLSAYTENLCYGEESVGYRLFVDGENVTESGTAAIELDGTMNTQKVLITVTNEKAPTGTTEYILHILKSPPVDVTFQISPGTALLNMHEVLPGERIWPREDGVFQLCEGYSYRYALTEYGYVGKSGILTVARNDANELIVLDGQEQYIVTERGDGGVVTIAWALTKASVNSAIDTTIVSPWPNFRGNNSNNAVTDVPIPNVADDGTLYWANQIGSGIDSDAVGSPILVGEDIITYASDKLYRVDRITGKILAEGTMDHKSSFSITPPTYANGMVFVALSNGCVQAFNAATLESLWIYNDPLGGQPNCPLAVKDGYLYTGFWNSETGNANFVCLSITDEQPGEAKEEKCSSWYYTAKGGYYWAGAYTGSDFVLIGTDDGDNSCTSQTSRMLLLNAKTGELLDSWNNLNGDIRSTVVYDSATNAYYFTSKGGSFYGFQVSGHQMINKWSVGLQNGVGGTPMSTCSPVVHNGRAYVGVSGAGQFSAYSGHNITVIDLGGRAIAYSVPTQGYPQTSGLLTTAYEATSGYAYVYFFDNYTPGKLRALRDKPGQSAVDYVTTEGSRTTAYALFTPTGDHAQYAICSPIVDEYGTIYFKNDSAHLMAFGSAIEKIEVTQMPAKTTYIAGETFDPTGMAVTATYANGMTRDITSYVSYHQGALSEQDSNFTISFTHVLYHNQEDGTAMKSGVATTSPNVTITLTIGGGLLGDVDSNGTIEAADAQMILDYEAQLLDQELILTVSDVSGDGVIDSNDAVLIQQYLAGKFETFPAEESVEEPAEESQPTE